MTLQGLGLLAGQYGYYVSYVVHLDKWVLENIETKATREFESVDDIEDWFIKKIKERDFK